MDIGKYQNLYRRLVHAIGSESQYEFCVELQNAGNPFLYTEEMCEKFILKTNVPFDSAIMRLMKIAPMNCIALDWNSEEELDLKLSILGF